MFGPDFPLLPVLAVVGYAAIVAGWLVLLRRWRLAGPLAPPKAALGRQERVARRSLKALLAFDALVIVPAGIVAVIGAIAAQNREILFLVLVTIFFLGPVKPMLRNVHALEARRLAGMPEPSPAALTTGHDGMDRLLRRPTHATRAMVAVIAGLYLPPSLLSLIHAAATVVWGAP